MARHKHSGEQGKTRKKGKGHQGYALLQGNAPEKLLDRGAPVRSFGKLEHSLTWGEIIAEEQNRTLPEGAVALPAVAQKPEDEQLEEDALPIAGVGEPAAEPAVGQPAAETGAVQAGNKGEEEAQPGQLEVEAGAEAPVVQPEAQLGAEAVGEKLPAAEEASEEEEAFEDEEASEDEETSDDEEAFEAAYQPPAVFYKHNDWERGEKGDEPERIRQKPYLEVVVETPNVGSREAMDANTDPGHTSAVLEFTAKTPSDEYRRARLHVGFHPRAGAGIGGMEEALLHRTDYPGEVQNDSDTLTSASVRRRFPIDKDKVKAALNVMDKYDSGMPYNLIYNNCTTFVANVAKQAAIPGVEGAFQETDWHFGLKAKAKLAFLQMFGRTMGAVKNKPAEMKALLQKRDFNAYDKMRLSGAELQHYLESRQQGRGGSMKFHGYSPSDVAENLLAMQDDKSVLIVNKPESDKDEEKDENYWFQHAARVHMLGKLGNAKMDGATPDGAKEALGLPAPQDFSRDIKKAATRRNYFSSWRREIRKNKDWSNPFGPKAVTDTVEGMPKLLENALEQYQVIRTVKLGVGTEDLEENAEKLSDTLQEIKQQAGSAVGELKNSKAPDAFVNYWDRLMAAGEQAGKFTALDDVAEDEQETPMDADEREAAEVFTGERDSIPLDRTARLLAREPDDALEEAVRGKLAGSALAPVLHDSISTLLGDMHAKMDGIWLQNIEGKSLLDMTGQLAVLDLLPGNQKLEAYEELLAGLHGSKGQAAWAAWQAEKAKITDGSDNADSQEESADKNANKKRVTVEDAIERHLSSNEMSSAHTMLLGLALRKAALTNGTDAETVYQEQRKKATRGQAINQIKLDIDQHKTNIVEIMVPDNRVTQIKNAIRGALQDKPVGETLKEEEIGKEIASYKEAMQTALLGLFPEGFAGGEDSAQVIAEKACERLQQKVQQADKNDVEKVVRKETLAKGLQQMSESDLNSVTDGWEKLQTRYGQTVALAKAEAEKTHDQVTVRFAMGGLQILGIVKNSPKKQKVSLMQAERERMEGFKLEMTNILENARELLKKYGLESEYGIAYGVIASALEKKKPLDQLLG